MSVELDFVERAVLILVKIPEFLEEHSWISFFSSGVSVLFNFCLFRYHFIKIQSYDYFIANYDVVGRFGRRRFSSLKWLCMTVPIAGYSVIIFSFATRFDTLKFLRFFGVKKRLIFLGKRPPAYLKIKP